MFNAVLQAKLPRLTTPLFTYRVRALDVARIGWQGGLILGLGAILGIGLGVFVAVARSTPSSDAYALSGQIGAWLFYPAVLLLLVSNTIYAATALSAAQKLRARREELDALRMTGLEEHEIIAAEFAAWQLRVWRFMAFECAVRLALAAFIIADFLLPNQWRISSSGDTFVVVVFFVFATTYILEPLWRMRALGSTAILWTVRSNNPLLAGMLTFLVALGSHGIMIGVMFGYVTLYVIAAFSPDNLHSYLTFGTIPLVWLIPRFSHRWLTKLTLKAVANALKRSEPA
jgi:hypothetical protein